METSNINSEPQAKLQGNVYVRTDYKPSSPVEEKHLWGWALELGLIKSTTREGDSKKYVLCLSDFCMASKVSEDRLICWPMNANRYSGSAYSYKIAAKTKNKLVDAGCLEVAQRGEKGISQIYRITCSIPGHLRFEEHDLGPGVEVRTAKPEYLRNGRRPKGQKLSIKGYLPQAQPLLEEMKLINKAMQSHPLTTSEGVSYARCTRIFNNGSLKRGGRVYGDWQRYNSDQRLSMTIDGEGVCEIDIKACYLHTAKALAGSNQELPEDPYSILPMVSNVSDSFDRKKKRDGAKVFLSAYVSKGGTLTKFPKNFRANHDIPKKEKVATWTKGLLSTFPFLTKIDFASGELMRLESDMMISAILTLIGEGVPSYPVHDCLIVKKRDEQKAVEALQASMLKYYGHQAHLEVEYLSGKSKIVYPSSQELHNSISKISCNKLDDFGSSLDFDVVDEEDMMNMIY